uniref:Uncharacterized protein n=1 Tax=Rhizochromulina marina TaxID=1034831 RepID=A0A7S2S817_9STRA|mmetsp:Transcript_26434/g.77073  ORF Transcript_26434/g.77073 Transcript_26434/m.77073 type:complete len:123 (+) Transcript_26434:276-644(+)
MAAKDPLNAIVEHVKNLYQPFLMGGCTVALIKLLGNRVSPAWAAVLGAFPLGMVSSSTIVDKGKFEGYLHNYPIMVVVLLLAMGVYRYSYYELKLPRPEALKRAMMAWALLAIATTKALLKF